MRFPGLRRKGKAWYYDAGGKPRRWIALGSDEATALRKYHALRGEKELPTDCVDRMLDEYAAALKASGKVKASTLRQYRIFKAHLSRVFGDQPARSLTQADAARYLEECPRTSARGELSFLSGAYRRWMYLGRLTFNPCIGAKTDKPRSRRDRLLSRAELLAILDKATPHLALAIELAYATGLRPCDLLALRWDSFAEGEHVRALKNGVRQRYELDDGLRDLLARAKSLQGRVVSLYVLSKRAGRSISRSTLERWWRAAAIAAKVDDAQFRDIRAAAGTEADAQGGIAAAQAFLGHLTSATTRIYLRGKKVTTVRPLRLKA